MIYNRHAMRKPQDRIVFLDAGTVDWNDLSFKELEALGKFRACRLTKLGEVEKRSRAAEIVITNKCRFEARLLGRLKNLRLIAVTATGVNNIDLAAARKHKIAVANVPRYSTETVVQCTFGFLLALAGSLVKFHEAVRSRLWSRSHFFTLPYYPIREIWGKTLGILGYGAIGRRVAQAAKAFGMKVLVGRTPGKKYPSASKVRRVSFRRVIRESDFLTIHAPLTKLTRNLIDETVIRKMKPGAFLINMARGGIVDEIALRRALVSGRLAGAAADVLTAEPPPRNHPLLGAPNMLLTPHVAWASVEARRRVVREVAQNIKAFQKGKRRNRVV